LLAKKGTSPSHGDVFATHPKVKVIFWGFLNKNAGFWILIEDEEGFLSCFMNELIRVLLRFF
jgi:hypothetical protein